MTRHFLYFQLIIIAFCSKYSIHQLYLIFDQAAQMIRKDSTNNSRRFHKTINIRNFQLVIIAFSSGYSIQELYGTPSTNSSPVPKKRPPKIKTRNADENADEQPHAIFHHARTPHKSPVAWTQLNCPPVAGINIDRAESICLASPE